MVLNDTEITRLVKQNESLVDFSRSCGTLSEREVLAHVNPNSLDLTLSGIFLRPRASFFDIDIIEYGKPYKADKYWKKYVCDSILLNPGEVLLAQSREYIVMPPHLCGQVFLKSSLGRLFIEHMMAGVIDAGFEGTVTLELANLGKVPVVLHEDDRVVQLVLSPLNNPARYPYNMRESSRYVGQKNPTPSRAERAA